MAAKAMPKRLEKSLRKDIEMLTSTDEATKENWSPDYQERRLTFEEIGKLIHAGKDDIEIILSPNTNTYWLYSNVLDAYCDMDYDGWEQDESFIRKLVDNGEHLYPLMGWTFGRIDL